MEQHIISISAVILATLLCLSLHFLITKLLFPRKKPNLPPGPKPWPVIGNLDLLANGRAAHQSLDDLSKEYGPIMQLKIGSFPAVVASSAEAAKIFLKTMDANFVSRPQTSAGKYIAYNYSDILWSSYGPYLSQARKLCSTELLSSKRVDSYEYIRAEERDSMLKGVFESAGKPIPLKSVLSTMTTNLMSRTVLGKKYLVDGDGSGAAMSLAEVKEMLEEGMFLNGAFNIGDYIPCINFLDLQGYVWRMKVLSKKIDRFLEPVVAEHEARRRETPAAESRDMVDVLLQLVEDPNLEVKIERHGIKAFTLDLLAAGSDTMVMTLVWAMFELLKNPTIMKKATEELDRVIGQEKWVKETDLPNLPFIDAILKEVMRIHPLAPILMPRLAREDCQVAGYDVKKGTLVLINAWTIHMDPSNWENPTEFNPERFIGMDIDIKGQDIRMLPFGSGRRMCPANALGLKVIQSTLANLLHGFDWTLPDNMKPEDFPIEKDIGLSTKLLVVAHPRLPLHLYNSL